ncbi:uncharacterized protein LOC34623216 [Cyclospora cayetanensis]|uniref:Uncharacterized protein LOC34623216 n=1 Tax=Cyclospora cayetanensis TaxID=88456 RepID=A0A6P6RTT6_9EIME|nr:uncharacterized protein LOC34623216 [Cyclospora cayetanensis]
MSCTRWGCKAACKEQRLAAANAGAAFVGGAPALAAFDAAAFAPLSSASENAAAPKVRGGAKSVRVPPHEVQQGCLRAVVEVVPCNKAVSSQRKGPPFEGLSSENATVGAITAELLFAAAAATAAHVGASPAAARAARAEAAAGMWRGFASITASEARQGNILLVDGRRVEVMEFRLVKSGRGAASVSLSYVDLESLKSGTQTFSVQKKLEKIHPEKQLLHLMYVDTSNGAVVMADEKFDEVTIPLRLFGGPAVAEHLTPEMQLAVWMHEGEPIKVQLPPSVLTVLR